MNQLEVLQEQTRVTLGRVKEGRDRAEEGMKSAVTEIKTLQVCFRFHVRV